MDLSFNRPAPPQRATAIAVTIGIHVLVLGLFYLSRPTLEAQPDGRSMVFWFVKEKVAEKLPAVTLPPARPPARPARPTAVPVPPRSTSSALPAPPVAVTEAPSSPEAPSVTAPAAAPGAEDIMNQARKDAGGIDRELRNQIPKGLVRAPISTPYKRFVKGVELANEMAPTAWYEAPKIKEVINPGGNGARRYRVGNYCLSYYDNRNRAGNDPIGNGIAKPTVPTICPPNEQPATTQE